MLDVEMQRVWPARNRALKAGLREVDVHSASRVRERLHYCAVGPGLSDAADQTGASRHDHARADAIDRSAIDLERAAEAVRAAADNLCRHHAVAERTLEVQGLAEARVLLRRSGQLRDLAPPR